MSVPGRIIRLNSNSLAEASSRVFGKTQSGKAVFEHRLTNGNGLELRAIDFGASITHLKTTDRAGRRRNIVLNYRTLGEYEQCQHYVGAVVGRYAGRIAHGAYVDDGRTVQLQKNENDSCLHGGHDGFHKQVWRGRVCEEGGAVAIEFSLVSKDGAGGFPGRLEATVRYALSDNDELNIEYEARTSAPTHVNLTQHSYFNLSGRMSTSIADHELQIDAVKGLDFDGNGIPTGKYLAVENSKFDFRVRRALGDAANWLDHDFVNPDVEAPLWKAGSLYHPESGRRVAVSTDQPSLHVYAGWNLGGDANAAFRKSAGLCLETQKFPNSPNVPVFPSTKIIPGQTYRHRTVYSFSDVSS